MTIFDDLQGTEPDISVNLDKFGSVAAMDVGYERYKSAGKYGVFTLKLGNHSGMIPIEAKVKLVGDGNEYASDNIEEITIAVDGGWEVWDLLEGCKMIVTSEELHDKLA